ncbi:hypothetical protein EDC01DRAFT_748996, partial [Geopyxis carbonaria]
NKALCCRGRHISFPVRQTSPTTQPATLHQHLHSASPYLNMDAPTPYFPGAAYIVDSANDEDFCLTLHYSSHMRYDTFRPRIRSSLLTALRANQNGNTQPGAHHSSLMLLLLLDALHDTHGASHDVTAHYFFHHLHQLATPNRDDGLYLTNGTYLPHPPGTGPLLNPRRVILKTLVDDRFPHLALDPAHPDHLTWDQFTTQLRTLPAQLRVASSRRAVSGSAYRALLADGCGARDSNRSLALNIVAPFAWAFWRSPRTAVSEASRFSALLNPGAVADDCTTLYVYLLTRILAAAERQPPPDPGCDIANRTNVARLVQARAELRRENLWPAVTPHLRLPYSLALTPDQRAATDRWTAATAALAAAPDPRLSKYTLLLAVATHPYQSAAAAQRLGLSDAPIFDGPFLSRLRAHPLLTLTPAAASELDPDSALDALTLALWLFFRTPTAAAGLAAAYEFAAAYSSAAAAARWARHDGRAAPLAKARDRDIAAEQEGAPPPPLPRAFMGVYGALAGAWYGYAETQEAVVALRKERGEDWGDVETVYRQVCAGAEGGGGFANAVADKVAKGREEARGGAGRVDEWNTEWRYMGREMRLDIP